MLASALSKEASAAVQDALALAQAIVDTVPGPLVVLEQDLRVVAASRSFYQIFGLVPDEIQGRFLYEIGDGQWDIPELRDLMDALVKDQADIEGHEIERDFPVIGRRTMLLNARKVFYETGTHTTVLLAFDDITARRAVEQKLQDLLAEKDTLLEEIQHRVANSLQIIASILLLKARSVTSEETRQHLKDAHQRVLSVAEVQRHLHTSAGIDEIDVGSYLPKLCSSLASSMVGEAQPIAVTVTAEGLPA